MYHPRPHIIIIDKYPTEMQCKQEMHFLEKELQTLLVYKQVIKLKCHPVRRQSLLLEEDEYAKRYVADSEK